MPYKKPKIEKIFYTTGEVAEMFQVNQSLIRFWEKEFPELTPKKNNRGKLLFTPQDLETFRLIYHLVKERGLTLKGARKKMRENKEETIDNFEIIRRLKWIREELVALRNELPPEEE